jgi:hypothetical protein
LFIKFDEIVGDRDTLLGKLSTFFDKEVNKEMVKFYDQFKLAQRAYLGD